MSGKRAFTLIELLATLAIMAVIAALLFPFVSNYTQQASITSTTRSLKILQDSIDKFVSIQSTNWNYNWTNNSGVVPGPATNRFDLATNDVEQIITDITTPGPARTLQQPATPITDNMVRIMYIGDGVNGSYVVWRYRMSTNGQGVDRNGNLVPGADFMSPSTNLAGE